MFIDFKKYNLPIEEVDDEDAEYLRFKTSSYTYQFRAIGECCSNSIFQTYKDIPFSFVIGKIIKNVKEIDEENDFNVENELDVEKTHLYQMTFKNSDETFKFLLVNYSNGYYDGWISSSVVL